MSMWAAVLVACGGCFVLKLLGYLVPPEWLAGERTSRITTLLPVALLMALVCVQAFAGDGGSLALDARVASVGVAVVLLILRANFIVVVLAAALVAAALRWFGIG